MRLFCTACAAQATNAETALSASSCGREAVAGKDAAEAERAFEARKLAPREWEEAKKTKDLDDLVFRHSGRYLSWAAVGAALAEQALFGTAPSAKSFKTLAAKHPLVSPKADLALGAKAFRGEDLSFDAVDAWLNGVLAPTADDLAFVKLGLTGLPKAPRFKKAARDDTKKKKKKSSPTSKASSARAPSRRPASSSRPTKTPSKAAREAREKELKKERAEREKEVRARMEADAEEFIPQTVDVDVDGDAAPWPDSDEDDEADEADDDDDDDDEEEEEDDDDDDGDDDGDYEMI